MNSPDQSMEIMKHLCLPKTYYFRTFLAKNCLIVVFYLYLIRHGNACRPSYYEDITSPALINKFKKRCNSKMMSSDEMMDGPLHVMVRDPQSGEQVNLFKRILVSILNEMAAVSQQMETSSNESENLHDGGRLEMIGGVDQQEVAGPANEELKNEENEGQEQEEIVVEEPIARNRKFSRASPLRLDSTVDEENFDREQRQPQQNIQLQRRAGSVSPSENLGLERKRSNSALAIQDIGTKAVLA